SLVIPWLSAVCRAPAVEDGEPIVNWPGPAGDAVVAVNVRSRVVPSGRAKVNLMASPSAGVAPLRSTESVSGGPPLGCVTAAPAIAVVAPTNLKPNGEASSVSATPADPDGPTATRPMPAAPRSACLRSAIT